MEKLTEEQIKNWRKALIHTLGPYALLMPDEQIQVLFERMQSGLTQRAVDPPSALVCTCDLTKKPYHDEDCPLAGAAGN